MKPHPRIRKTIKWGGAALMVATLATIGVVINVLVAWAVSFPASRRGFGYRHESVDNAYWPVKVPNGWPDPHSTTKEYWWWGSGTVTRSGKDGAFYGVSYYEMGWPARSMSLWCVDGPNTTNSYFGKGYQHAWKAPYPGGGFVYPGVPLCPVWPAFAANSAVYATACAVLWMGPKWIRASRRRRLNLCPKCSYDRTGLTPGVVCPECGAAAPKVG